MRRFLIFVLAAVLAGAVGGAVVNRILENGGSTSGTSGVAAPTPGNLGALTGTALADANVREQILKTNEDIAHSQADKPWLGRVTALGGFAGGIAALFAIAVQVRSQRQAQEDAIQKRHDEQMAQLKADQAAAQNRLDQQIAQSERERRQQSAELQRRFDRDFAAALAALAGDAAPTQIAGAITLRTYLRPETASYHQQVYDAVLANLHTDIAHADPVRFALVALLRLALPLVRPDINAATRPVKRAQSSGLAPGAIDLAHRWLRRIDLSGANLGGADIAFCQLQGARLEGTNLQRCRGYGVNLDQASLEKAILEEARLRGISAVGANFSGARLVSARLEEGQLQNARFYGAHLQSAHLDKAHLEGADFRGSELADASFTGATFDDGALTSIVLAGGWHAGTELRAHFDADIAAKLLAMSSDEGLGHSPA